MYGHYYTTRQLNAEGSRINADFYRPIRMGMTFDEPLMNGAIVYRTIFTKFCFGMGRKKNGGKEEKGFLAHVRGSSLYLKGPCPAEWIYMLHRFSRICYLAARSVIIRLCRQCFVRLFYVTNPSSDLTNLDKQKLTTN